MRVFHITRRRLAMAGTSFLLLIVAAFLLPGCQQQEESTDIVASTEAERIAFLEKLGWQVSPEPIETLDLQLSDSPDENWSRYAQLQEEQGLPFADYAGQTVRRYTYTVLNYPDIPQGVQANLYFCGDTLIGGDIIFLGQGGFQKDLNYPTTEKA